MFAILVHVAMKDTILMNVVYMYIHYQRTENERSAHNQVNIPTIPVGAHEQKTEDPLSLSWAPDTIRRHDHFQPDYSNYNTYTHALDQLVRKHFITIIIIIY